VVIGTVGVVVAATVVVDAPVVVAATVVVDAPVVVAATVVVDASVVVAATVVVDASVVVAATVVVDAPVVAGTTVVVGAAGVVEDGATVSESPPQAEAAMRNASATAYFLMASACHPCPGGASPGVVGADTCTRYGA